MSDFYEIPYPFAVFRSTAMLTAERFNEIRDIVDKWNEKERSKDDYPVSVSLYKTTLCCTNWFLNREECLKTAKELGIEPDEIRQYFEQVEREFDNTTSSQ